MDPRSRSSCRSSCKPPDLAFHFYVSFLRFIPLSVGRLLVLFQRLLSSARISFAQLCHCCRCYRCCRSCRCCRPLSLLSLLCSMLHLPKCLVMEAGPELPGWVYDGLEDTVEVQRAKMGMDSESMEGLVEYSYFDW